jgi:uncharacterized protein (TIGR03435 family)
MPKFDVISVKECKTGAAAPPSSVSAGRLSLGCFNLRTAIQQAYDVFASGKADPLSPAVWTMPLEGLPAWANAARYSIDAATEHPQTAAMMRGPMMQALLEERFHLKVRRESREGTVFLMTAAKGGLKIHASKEDSCSPLDFSEALNFQPGERPWCGMANMSYKGPLTVLDIHGIALSTFAKMLHPEGSPVVDRTGIEGTFDIHMEWSEDHTPPAAGTASDPAPHTSAIIATREQLGLELRPAKGTREVLIVDRLERPSGN